MCKPRAQIVMLSNEKIVFWRHIHWQ